jgi:hypothetical protein
MTRAERSSFASLVEHAVAPAPPLPPLGATDATDAFVRYLRLAPAANRAALRCALLALELVPLALGERHRLSRLGAARRDALLTRLERGRLAPLAAALVGLAHLFYYGDERVMRQLGYDARAVVERGRALRASESRW